MAKRVIATELLFQGPITDISVPGDGTIRIHFAQPPDTEVRERLQSLGFKYRLGGWRIEYRPALRENLEKLARELARELPGPIRVSGVRHDALSLEYYLSPDENLPGLADALAQRFAVEIQ